jgi:hypothetical protein
MNQVTFNKEYTGMFSVFLNGQIVNKYYIFNGSAGMSGLGNNMYGIKNEETNKVVWIGSLQKAKKTVTLWLNK